MSKATSNITSSRPGVVMLELVIAILLIGVSTMAIYLSLIYSQKISTRAAHVTRAMQLASQEMEIIRSLPYASLTTPYNGAFIGSAEAASDLPSGSENLTTSYYDSPTNTIKKAVVTVSWTEKSGSKQIQYTTFVVNQGVNQ